MEQISVTVRKYFQFNILDRHVEHSAHLLKEKVGAC